MNPPPLTLGLTLLFWGWQTDQLIIAAALALLMESPVIIKKRWSLSFSDWSKITDISAVILLSVLAIKLLQEERQLVYAIASKLPIILFPLLLAQRFSDIGKVEISALSLLERKKTRSTPRCKPVDLTYIYLLSTLMAAGIGQTDSDTYFPGVVVLGLLIISTLRSPQCPKLIWLALIAVVCLAGVIGHLSINRLGQHIYLMASQYFDSTQSPLATTTALGDIGNQKLYNHIIFRARPENKFSYQPLLREASYNIFDSKSWYAFRAPMIDLAATGRNNWVLKNSKSRQSIRITGRIHSGSGIVPLPQGATRITNLKAEQVSTNALGAVTFDKASQKTADYTIEFNPDIGTPGAPTSHDYKIPKSELEDIRIFTESLNITDQSPQEIIRILQQHFDQNYTYSLHHKGRGEHQTPLGNFLLNHKSGHCELFATATVLSLRAFGIPARYAVGYAAAEYSPLEKQFIVRQRHGHAWCLVYYDGQWHNLDTTSGNWLEIESERKSVLTPIADFFSYLKYRFNLLREDNPNLLGKTAAGLILILISMVFRRLHKQKRTLKKAKEKNKGNTPTFEQGLDSPFFQTICKLEKMGYPRYESETLHKWADRMHQASPELLDYDVLTQLIDQHYAMRFSKEKADHSMNQLLGSLNLQRS